MKRVQILSILFFGFALLSACGKRRVDADFDASKTGFLIQATDGSLYRADCLGHSGDIALNSSSAAQCKLNASSNRQAANFSFSSYTVINSDFARYFCQNIYRRNAYACFNFFGIGNYQPLPNYQTCNTCVNCPFGGLCPQYCFTSCSRPYQPYNPYPEPWPNPYPTQSPTPTVSPVCQATLTSIKAMVSTMSYCSRDSDCVAAGGLNDRCNSGINVNKVHASNAGLTTVINQYNQVCRPSTPVICPQIMLLPTCQNNRCLNNF